MVVIITNGQLSNASAVNFIQMSTRRVELHFGVGYESNIAHVKKTILDVIQNHEMTLNDPAPFVRLSEHADSALVFKVRVWVNSADYWTVHFDLLEQVKEAFDRESINIPYPHVEVIASQEA